MLWKRRSSSTKVARQVARSKFPPPHRCAGLYSYLHLPVFEGSHRIHLLPTNVATYPAYPATPTQNRGTCSKNSLATPGRVETPKPLHLTRGTRGMKHGPVFAVEVALQVARELAMHRQLREKVDGSENPSPLFRHSEVNMVRRNSGCRLLPPCEFHGVLQTHRVTSRGTLRTLKP